MRPGKPRSAPPVPHCVAHPPSRWTHSFGVRQELWYERRGLASRRNGPSVELPSVDETLYRKILDLRTTKGDRKRRELLESLVVAIAEDGWENVSFETLGKRTGMRKGHVAYYFTSRSEMLQTAVKYVIAVGQSITIERLQAAETPEKKLKAWVESSFEWIERHPNHSAVMRLFYYLCAYEPSYRSLQAEIWRMGGARGAEIVGPVLAGKATLAERSRLAEEVQALVLGMLLESVVSGSEGAIPKAKARALNATRRLLALGPTPATKRR